MMIFSRVIVLSNGYRSARRVALLNISRGRYFKLYRVEEDTLHLSELTASLKPKLNVMPTVFFRENAKSVNGAGVGDVFLMGIISHKEQSDGRMYDLWVRVE